MTGRLLLRRGSPTRRLRSLSLRVAIRATLIALAAGILVCAVADLVVVHRISSAIDGRLNNQLSLLIHESPRQIGAQTSSRSHGSSHPDGDDLDDVPILAWSIPRGSSRALTLNADSPKLPRSDFRVTHFTGARLGAREVRLEGRSSRRGRFVVGTSTAEIGSVLTTLLVIQGVLAPLALLGLFVAATLIGQRAAAPIDEARLRQLEFTADASHELRTPLSVIEAEVSLALATPRNASEYRAALERVAGESKRLRRIVEDLLWLARLDALPTGPAHEAVAVSTVAESCVDRFQVLAAERGISLSMDESIAPVPIIVAPVEWVDQLIAVLLDNACRYTNDAGRIEVHVNATEDEVTLRVDDSGPGFAEGGPDLAMQRFHRDSDLPGGAGIGLAIAKAVVEATSGRISLGRASLGGASVNVAWPRIRSRPGAGPAHGRHAVRSSESR